MVVGEHCSASQSVRLTICRVLIRQSQEFVTSFTIVKSRMTIEPPTDESSSSSTEARYSNKLIVIVTLATTVLTLMFVLVFLLSTIRVTPKSLNVSYPIGIASASDPSGFAPPTADALKGYSLGYVTDFSGPKLPSGWDVFSGVPGGDPGGQFALNHVVVKGGFLQLNTWRDPKYKNRWVTGGLCQCGLGATYRAYFVRSRITGPGPNEVQLLWPVSNKWPPEVDFNETGSSDTSTSSTVHYGATNQIDQMSIRINMTMWHTWGIVWTKSSISYVVDGRVWATITVPSEIPRVAMRLDLEQRTMCRLATQCPKVPVSMLVDWVAEYSPN